MGFFYKFRQTSGTHRRFMVQWRHTSPRPSHVAGIAENMNWQRRVWSKKNFFFFANVWKNFCDMCVPTWPLDSTTPHHNNKQLSPCSILGFELLPPVRPHAVRRRLNARPDDQWRALLYNPVCTIEKRGHGNTTSSTSRIDSREHVLRNCKKMLSLICEKLA